MTRGVIGSANRDETVFENANALDIAREPNKHLSFGQGIHFCVGAPLARLEAQIAINTLLRRMPELHLSVAADSLRWPPSMILRGLETLPASFRVAPIGIKSLQENATDQRQLQFQPLGRQ